MAAERESLSDRGAAAEHDPVTCELCHAEGVGAELAALRAENERVRETMQADLDRLAFEVTEAERELRVFQAGLTDVLRVYNVPAMPSWAEAIHWLARNGRPAFDEEGRP